MKHLTTLILIITILLGSSFAYSESIERLYLNSGGLLTSQPYDGSEPEEYLGQPSLDISFSGFLTGGVVLEDSNISGTMLLKALNEDNTSGALFNIVLKKNDTAIGSQEVDLAGDGYYYIVNYYITVNEPISSSDSIGLHISSACNQDELRSVMLDGDYPEYSKIDFPIEPSSVAAPPEITNQPDDQEVYIGEIAVFSVEADGDDLQYQWLKDGYHIPDATFSSYTTPPVTFADDGSEYSCIVSNSAGSVESDWAELSVIEETIEPPQITSHPESQTVEEGDTARFSVKAEGDDLQYQWQKNYTDISGATKSKHTTPPVSSDDNGDLFRCVVSNVEGSRTSSSARLTVTSKAPEAAFTASPKSGKAPLNVQFTDQSKGDIYSWAWTFGNGKTGSGKNISHTYDEPGTYQATLTVKGSGGTDTASATIAVFPIEENDSDYLVAINIKAEDDEQTEPSGSLPGSNFSQAAPSFKTRDSNRSFYLQDVPMPKCDASLIYKTRKLLEQKSRTVKIASQTFNLDDKKDFWVLGDRVAATLKKEGRYGYIFVETTLSIPDDILELYITEFDVMYELVRSKIGEYTDRDHNGKVSILLCNLGNNGLGGFFAPYDYYAQEILDAEGIDRKSNEMDLLYVNGNYANNYYHKYILTTFIHEYQHMVNFCETGWNLGRDGFSSDIWITEMMSMASETMYLKAKLEDDPSFTNPEMLNDGYLTRITYYNDDKNKTIRNGHGLTWWDSNNDEDRLANYALAYIFGQYLAIHSSINDKIFKEILDYMVEHGVGDYQAVEAVASKRLPNVDTWEDLLKNWALANLLNDRSGPYGYKGEFILTAHGPTSSRVNIHNGGVVYRKISESYTCPTGAGSNIRFFEQDGSNVCDSGSDDDDNDDSCPDGFSIDCGNGICCPDSHPYCLDGPYGGMCAKTQNPDPFCLDNPSDDSCCDAGDDDDDDDGSCPDGFSIDCGNGICCPDSHPYCQDEPYEGLCAKTPSPDSFCLDNPYDESCCGQTNPPPQGACPFAYMLGDTAAETSLLREFRDSVLGNTAAGREIINLYYTHFEELTAIISNDRSLRVKSLELLFQVLPEIQSAINGNAVNISKNNSEKINKMCTEVIKKASPALGSFINKLQQELNEGTLFNKLNIALLD